jgi:hypothetical protein
MPDYTEPGLIHCTRANALVHEERNAPAISRVRAQ